MCGADLQGLRLGRSAPSSARTHAHTAAARGDSPCPPSPKHQGNGVAGQHPSQAGEVRVPVWGPLEDSLVHFHLREGPGAREGWARSHTLWPDQGGFLYSRPKALSRGQQETERPPPPESPKWRLCWARAMRALSTEPWGQAGCGMWAASGAPSPPAPSAEAAFLLPLGGLR